MNLIIRAVFSIAVLLGGFAVQAANTELLPQPVMIKLSTGSNVATWTVADNTEPRQTPVIYLHGGPGGFITTAVVDKGASLRAAGFTTVYFDQAGGGLSERLVATEYTLERAVNDVEALRIALNVDRIILWGSSYGADLAVLYEQRFPSRVEALIFTSPGIFPGTKPKYDYRLTNDQNISPGKALINAARKIDREGGGAEATLSQATSGQLFDENLNEDALDGRMICKGSTAPKPAKVAGANLYPNRMLLKELKGLKLKIEAIPARPVITIRGACDFIPLANAQKYQDVYGGTVVIVEQAGHGLRTNREAFDSALRNFVEQQLSATK